jgi:serine/threonine-protein kinase
VANVSFVSVPNVVGLQEDDARARLRAVGLEPAVVSVHSLSQVASVVAQHPAPGVDVARSSRVTISVSGGPGP